ncbi:NAD-dependent epimerase/dehydratase family protein [Amycolatopsis cihanbeyliensis]|uniref:Nucleoside-diphosphate-sugar epimerase n=1 Tax=Amycolatopsis cihanbeyliensis TaxID=1128664 RepID=A0A542DRU1_AMYCI|nr:NAD(P)-dependent oxidoreductase [Amycolatopsis cihanbeyliensis]TQJ05812.1 nucleoside-diphosphate-sugar epimerase [Amycolatopsis cihanbeyliensis]
MPARVLLFGANGFLGRQVAHALAEDPRVGVLIRAGRSAPAGPDWIQHDLVTATVTELSTVLRRTRPDAVINCAGRLSGDATELVEANVLVTAKLLDAMAEHARGLRLVVLGSAAEYGVVPMGQPVTETDPTSPVAPYGATRLASTQLARLAGEQGRVDAVALRLFNPVGPGLPAENVLGKAAVGLRAALAHGRDHIRLGPLDTYRDFVDVRDVAAAIREAALVDWLKDQVLNVGGGMAVAVRDAVRLLAEVAGFPGEIHESEPAPSRSSTVNWIAADLTRIRQALGWAPRYDLRAMIRAAWEER